MKIVVSSNCQTAGLTIALRMLLPGADIAPFPYAGLGSDEMAGLAGQLSHADIWVVTAPKSVIDDVRSHGQFEQLQILTLPELYFDAFHPDLVYAWLPTQSTLDTPAGPYNSAIALWGWRRNLDVGETVALFTPEVFERLGYTKRWELSIARMKSDFDVHHLDHRHFILPLQRRGVFMHPVNHPTVAALAQLSRLLAARLGADAEVLAEPVENFMTDGLMAASTVWPVYPSIANALGMTGSFTWKLPSQAVVRLEEFIQGSFDMYATQSGVFACHQLDWPMYDPTLEMALSEATR